MWFGNVSYLIWTKNNTQFPVELYTNKSNKQAIEAIDKGLPDEHVLIIIYPEKNIDFLFVIERKEKENGYTPNITVWSVWCLATHIRYLGL